MKPPQRSQFDIMLTTAAKKADERVKDYQPTVDDDYMLLSSNLTLQSFGRVPARRFQNHHRTSFASALAVTNDATIVIVRIRAIRC